MHGHHFVPKRLKIAQFRQRLRDLSDSRHTWSDVRRRKPYDTPLANHIMQRNEQLRLKRLLPFPKWITVTCDSRESGSLTIGKMDEAALNPSLGMSICFAVLDESGTDLRRQSSEPARSRA